MTLIRNISDQVRENTPPGKLKKVDDLHVLDYLTTKQWGLAGDDLVASEAEWEAQQAEAVRNAIKQAAKDAADAENARILQEAAQKTPEEVLAAKLAGEAKAILDIQGGVMPPKPLEVTGSPKAPKVTVVPAPKRLKALEIK